LVREAPIRAAAPDCTVSFCDRSR